MAPEIQLTILKIGGSVITYRGDDRPRLRRKRLVRIAREIARGFCPGQYRLVIIHGAGSFGHPIVERTGIARGVEGPDQCIALAETQRLQSLLNGQVVHCLLQAGLPAFPFQASASAVMDAGRLVILATEALEGMIATGMVPVLNGVPAYDRRQGCSILSGDQLAAHLYARLSADRILHGTDVKGLYSADPATNPRARFLEEVHLHIRKRLPPGVGGSLATDVTGGMRAKLEEMRRVGARGRIFDATVPGNVYRALAGEAVGTRIIPG